MTTKRHRKKIVRQLPPVGTTLKGRLRGETYTAVVAESEGLPGGWLLSGRRATRTPLTAARPCSVPPILSHIRRVFA